MLDFEFEGNPGAGFPPDVRFVWHLDGKVTNLECWNVLHDWKPTVFPTGLRENFSFAIPLRELRRLAAARSLQVRCPGTRVDFVHLFTAPELERLRLFVRAHLPVWSAGADAALAARLEGSPYFCRGITETGETFERVAFDLTPTNASLTVRFSLAQFHPTNGPSELLLLVRTRRKGELAWETDRTRPVVFTTGVVYVELPATPRDPPRSVVRDGFAEHDRYARLTGAELFKLVEFPGRLRLRLPGWSHDWEHEFTNTERLRLRYFRDAFLE